jgi:serine/threonine protein kinase
MAAYKKIGDTGIQYAKEDVLGRGTFGIVYLGIFNEEKIAVKKILLNLSEKEGREVDLQKNLSHENVLKICRVVEDDDFRYLIYACKMCITKETFFLTQIFPKIHRTGTVCRNTK